jgi:hypothetical protein
LPVAPRERAARAGKKTLDKLIGLAELHAAPATGATFAMAFATGDIRRHDRRRSVSCHISHNRSRRRVGLLDIVSAVFNRCAMA